MAKALFILNDPPYGTERSYNALRLAGAIAKRGGEEVKVFLMGDGASCAKGGQKVPQGYYNLELMLRSAAKRSAEIGVCGTCMDARGITEGELCEGARRSCRRLHVDLSPLKQSVSSRLEISVVDLGRGVAVSGA
jgi:uncharacterized protein involved in oxidation of intracellular sulfur